MLTQRYLSVRSFNALSGYISSDISADSGMTGRPTTGTDPTGVAAQARQSSSVACGVARVLRSVKELESQLAVVKADAGTSLTA